MAVGMEETGLLGLKQTVRSKFLIWLPYFHLLILFFMFSFRNPQFCPPVTWVLPVFLFLSFYHLPKLRFSEEHVGWWALKSVISWRANFHIPRGSCVLMKEASEFVCSWYSPPPFIFFWPFAGLLWTTWNGEFPIFFSTLLMKQGIP